MTTPHKEGEERPATAESRGFFEALVIQLDPEMDPFRRNLAWTFWKAGVAHGQADKLQEGDGLEAVHLDGAINLVRSLREQDMSSERYRRAWLSNVLKHLEALLPVYPLPESDAAALEMDLGGEAGEGA